MSVRVTAAVWQQSAARGTDRMVLLAIADHARDTGDAWPSVARLAELVGCSVRTVQRSLRHLEDLGEIVTTHAAGRGTSFYRVALPLPDPDRPNPQLPVRTAHRVAVLSPPGDTDVTTPVTQVSPEPLAKHQVRPAAAAIVQEHTDATASEAAAVVALVRQRRPGARSLPGLVARIAADGELGEWLAEVRAPVPGGLRGPAYAPVERPPEAVLTVASPERVRAIRAAAGI